tara:strand:+ start:367 stop:918 length:552 start_codon:yes stop_codon:yes gene_type:complete
MRLLTLISIVLMGCGTEPKDRRVYYDPFANFDYALQEFIKDYDDHANGLFSSEILASVTIVPSILVFDANRQPITGVVGVCRILGTHRSIQIDKTYFDKSSDIERRGLIWHELGHCVQLRGHDLRKLGDHCYSLMFPNVFPENMLNYCWMEMELELFEPQITLAESHCPIQPDGATACYDKGN